jgi:hypothetical protein
MAEKPKYSEEVLVALQEFERTKRYHSRNFNNEVENWHMYIAKNPEFGMGQWPMKVVQMMEQQGRQLVSYNFIKPTVDQTCSVLIQTPYDPEFLPVTEDIYGVTSLIKHIFYSDKELMDWKSTFFEIVKHGLVHRGIMKMIISDKYSKFGNIGFEMCLPGSIWTDPNWRTPYSKDCKLLYKETWLTAKEIKKLYPNSVDEIDALVGHNQMTGTTYGSDTGSIPYLTVDNVWGSLYRVIERYVMVKEKSNGKFIAHEGGDIRLPNNLDESAMRNFLSEHFAEYNAELIYERPEEIVRSKVSAICPTLLHKTKLEDAYTEVQCGRLPFFIWSAANDNGEPHTPVDSVKDPQVYINYNSAMIMDKIQSEGGGGAQYVDPTLFANSTEFEKWVKRRNHNNAHFVLRPGIRAKGISPSEPVRNSPFPNEIHSHLTYLLKDVWPNVSKTPPSSFARPEPGQETSGRLYQMLRQQGNNLLYPYTYSLRLFHNEVYEAYLLQAIQTYNNESVQREFEYDGKIVSINKLDGGGMVNDFSSAMRMRYKIIISDTQESPSDKMHNVAILTEFGSRIPPTQIGTLAIINNELAKNIDQFSKESKEKLAAVGELELENALGQLRVSILNSKVQEKQLMQALQQGQQGQQEQQGAQPPGAIEQSQQPVTEASSPEAVSTNNILPGQPESPEEAALFS